MKLYVIVYQILKKISIDSKYYCSQVPPRSVFVRILHENHETAGAKMSVLCSFCVHQLL